MAANRQLKQDLISSHMGIEELFSIEQYFSDQLEVFNTEKEALKKETSIAKKDALNKIGDRIKQCSNKYRLFKQLRDIFIQDKNKKNSKIEYILRIFLILKIKQDDSLDQSVKIDTLKLNFNVDSQFMQTICFEDLFEKHEEKDILLETLSKMKEHLGFNKILSLKTDDLFNKNTLYENFLYFYNLVKEWALFSTNDEYDLRTVRQQCIDRKIVTHVDDLPKDPCDLLIFAYLACYEYFFYFCEKNKNKISEIIEKLYLIGHLSDIFLKKYPLRDKMISKIDHMLPVFHTYKTEIEDFFPNRLSLNFNIDPQFIGAIHFGELFLDHKEKNNLLSIISKTEKSFHSKQCDLGQFDFEQCGLNKMISLMSSMKLLLKGTVFHKNKDEGENYAELYLDFLVFYQLVQESSLFLNGDEYFLNTIREQLIKFEVVNKENNLLKDPFSLVIIAHLFFYKIFFYLCKKHKDKTSKIVKKLYIIKELNRLFLRKFPLNGRKVSRIEYMHYFYEIIGPRQIPGFFHNLETTSGCFVGVTSFEELLGNPKLLNLVSEFLEEINFKQALEFLKNGIGDFLKIENFSSWVHRNYKGFDFYLNVISEYANHLNIHLYDIFSIRNQLIEMNVDKTAIPKNSFDLIVTVLVFYYEYFFCFFKKYTQKEFEEHFQELKKQYSYLDTKEKKICLSINHQCIETSLKESSRFLKPVNDDKEQMLKSILRYHRRCFWDKKIKQNKAKVIQFLKHKMIALLEKGCLKIIFLLLNNQNIQDKFIDYIHSIKHNSLIENLDIFNHFFLLLKKDSSKKLFLYLNAFQQCATIIFFNNTQKNYRKFLNFFLEKCFFLKEYEHQYPKKESKKIYTNQEVNNVFPFFEKSFDSKESFDQLTETTWDFVLFYQLMKIYGFLEYGVCSPSLDMESLLNTFNTEKNLKKQFLNIKLNLLNEKIDETKINPCFYKVLKRYEEVNFEQPSILIDEINGIYSLLKFFLNIFSKNLEVIFSQEKNKSDDETEIDKEKILDDETEVDLNKFFIAEYLLEFRKLGAVERIIKFKIGQDSRFNENYLVKKIILKKINDLIRNVIMTTYDISVFFNCYRALFFYMRNNCFPSIDFLESDFVSVSRIKNFFNEEEMNAYLGTLLPYELVDFLVFFAYEFYFKSSGIIKIVNDKNGLKDDFLIIIQGMLCKLNEFKINFQSQLKDTEEDESDLCLIESEFDERFSILLKEEWFLLLYHLTNNEEEFKKYKELINEKYKPLTDQEYDKNKFYFLKLFCLLDFLNKGKSYCLSKKVIDYFDNHKEKYKEIFIKFKKEFIDKIKNIKNKSLANCRPFSRFIFIILNFFQLREELYVCREMIACNVTKNLLLIEEDYNQLFFDTDSLAQPNKIKKKLQQLKKDTRLCFEKLEKLFKNNNFYLADIQNKKTKLNLKNELFLCFQNRYNNLNEQLNLIKNGKFKKPPKNKLEAYKKHVDDASKSYHQFIDFVRKNKKIPLETEEFLENKFYKNISEINLINELDTIVKEANHINQKWQKDYNLFLNLFSDLVENESCVVSERAFQKKELDKSATQLKDDYKKHDNFCAHYKETISKINLLKNEKDLSLNKIGLDLDGKYKEYSDLVRLKEKWFKIEKLYLYFCETDQIFDNEKEIGIHESRESVLENFKEAAEKFLNAVSSFKKRYHLSREQLKFDRAILLKIEKIEMQDYALKQLKFYPIYQTYVEHLSAYLSFLNNETLLSDEIKNELKEWKLLSKVTFYNSLTYSYCDWRTLKEKYDNIIDQIENYFEKEYKSYSSVLQNNTINLDNVEEYIEYVKELKIIKLKLENINLKEDTFIFRFDEIINDICERIFSVFSDQYKDCALALEDHKIDIDNPEEHVKDLMIVLMKRLQEISLKDDTFSTCFNTIINDIFERIFSILLNQYKFYESRLSACLVVHSSHVDYWISHLKTMQSTINDIMSDKASLFQIDNLIQKIEDKVTTKTPPAGYPNIGFFHCYKITETKFGDSTSLRP